MKRIAQLSLVLFGLAVSPAAAQITVTAPPSGANAVASANDYATTVLQDPWDMSQNTDGGWFVYSVDQPANGWTSASYANGVFTGVSGGGQAPNLWLLETGFMGAAPVGRFGVNYPIDASRYRVAAVRMCVTQPGGAMYFGWTANTIFDAPGLQYSNNVFTSAGCRFYIVDLPTLGGTGSELWTGTKRSLFFVPHAPPVAGNTVTLDWVRLVDSQPSLNRTITWSGTGPVDIYLDNNNTATSDPAQTLGLVASSVNGTSYTLNVGALQPGDYYVAIRRTGTTGNFSYSPGFYRVNAPATITVTSPSDEGSSDDYATVHLNNAWDMTSMSDIDHLINVSNPGIATIVGAETEAGAPLGNITAFVGASTTGVFSGSPCASYAKPAVYAMHQSVRGQTRRIDPSRYRILTAELGLPNKPRDICNGSIVRIVWHVAGEVNETYSDDIILNSRGGANVVSRLNMDMATLQIEPGSPSQTGWAPGLSPNPGIDSFRIDPHEFANPTTFFIKRMKLAARDTAHTSFNVQWTTSRTGGTINAYYDTDKDPASKTLIGSVSASSTSGSMSWNTSGLPDGAEYYVYVEQADGTNTNGAYSKWPVVIDHTPSSNIRLVPNRSSLNFGVVAQTIKTPAQTVRLSILNAPAGQPCWTATSDLPFLTVSPASGCGGASLTVGLVNQNYGWTGDYIGSIRITSPNALNSPQFVSVQVRVRATSAPPSGAVDTPANGAVVSGSIAVTGWAVDDIGVARVTICRNAVTGETAPPNGSCGANQIYLGDAVSVDDARPDVEALSAMTPLNYRAGWGFLVLTNMLPSQGNGTFTLSMYAFDQEGHQAALGSRAIIAQNSTAPEPFGAIDTPAQGETISGSNYGNFGWVLSRWRRADPPGGGSVFVYIDGLAVGSPGGWTSRGDLTALFPGYPGLSTALGVYGFDTNAYSNGVHTIVWVVSDSAGVASGVGSRYFNVFNSSGALTTASAAPAMRPAGPDLGRRVEDLGGRDVTASVGVREGFGLTAPLRQAGLGLDGVRRVATAERDRLEIRVAGNRAASSDGEYAGYLVVDGELRELPVGSSFDPSRGAFYWQPGLGYVGNYDLLFVRKGSDGARERIPVRVTLRERPSTAVASRATGPWAGVSFDR